MAAARHVSALYRWPADQSNNPYGRLLHLGPYIKWAVTTSGGLDSQLSPCSHSSDPSCRPGRDHHQSLLSQQSYITPCPPCSNNHHSLLSQQRFITPCPPDSDHHCSLPSWQQPVIIPCPVSRLLPLSHPSNSTQGGAHHSGKAHCPLFPTGPSDATSSTSACCKSDTICLWYRFTPILEEHPDWGEYSPISPISKLVWPVSRTLHNPRHPTRKLQKPPSRQEAALLKTHLQQRGTRYFLCI